MGMCGGVGGGVGRWVAGGFVVPLVLALTGVSAPVAVAAVGGGACVSPGGGGGGGEDRSAPVGGGGGCAGPRGPQGPKGDRGPKGERGAAGPCADFDSVKALGNQELSAALSRGRAYIGRRTVTGATVGAYVWKDLTTSANPGFPRDACAVSITHTGQRAFVKVLTTGGDVSEISCAYSAAGVTCLLGWQAVVRP